MKRYILSLIATILSLVMIAQDQKVKSEKTGFYIHETDTEYIVRASFPANRNAKLRTIILEALGEPKYPTDSSTHWLGSNYSLTITKVGMRMSLKREKLTRSNC